MGTIISAIQIILAVIALSMYLRVRQYLNQHTDEPVEEHSDWLMRRMQAIGVLALISALIGIVRIVL